MSPGITLSLHWWRGIGTDPQLDLFFVHLRFGIVTLSFERKDPLAAYLKLRETMRGRVAADEKAISNSLAQAHQREEWDRIRTAGKGK